MALSEQLQLLLAASRTEVVELWADGAFADLEAATAADPESVAAVFAELGGDRGDIEASVDQVVSLVIFWPDDVARALLGAIAGLGSAHAEAVVSAAAAFYDAESLVPAAILVDAGPGGAAPQDWASELLSEVAGSFDWSKLAELLDRVAEAKGAAKWLDQALEDQPWARENPAPSPNARVPTLPPLEADQARIPVADLFADDDPRVTLASAHAAAVAREASCWSSEGRSPVQWLGQLGKSLPGCGQPFCCRLGLFELALMSRGYYLRAGRIPPQVASPGIASEKSELWIREHPPEPPGPNFWKTVSWHLSRIGRRP